MAAVLLGLLLVGIGGVWLAGQSHFYDWFDQHSPFEAPDAPKRRLTARVGPAIVLFFAGAVLILQGIVGAS